MENDSINIKIEDNDSKKNKKKMSFSLRNLGLFINSIRVKDRKKGTIDLPFFFIVTILLVMGIIMMFSASYAWAISEGHEGIFYAKRQMLFALIGFVAMFLVSRIDYHFFQKRVVALGLYGFCIILLLMVKFTPFGRSHNEAQRWLGVGSFEFQPSEIMKFAIIILFGLMLVNNQKFIGDFKKALLPFVCLLAPVVFLLMKQPHLSCTILICLISVSMIYIGGMKHIHLIEIALGGAAVLGLAVYYKIKFEGFTYFENRFKSWLHPFSDTTGVTWQTDQSLVAIGSGGFFGMGLGNSRQKFQYLPESKNDFVFSIVCEELGFIGAATVILLFAFFVFRGFYIASKSPDRFGMLICVGLTAQVGYQAFLNIAVVSNLIPNTGISLPFFSYGGTSLLMLLGQVGIILNISRHMSEGNELREKRSEDLRRARKQTKASVR